MADVSHELGSLRFVVDAPLSSKVAKFNNQANQHMQSQLLNPFSQTDGRASPKPQFSKEEYGKPLAGSLTEMRGQKANIHVMKEMLELCQIIDSEGYNVKDEPKMRVIPFGELFNIYNYISDKVVGILLRARKHKLVQFEGEMLFQRRDDNVPIFLLKPIHEIRELLECKIEEIKRASSPLPQATSVLLDKSAHLQKLKEADGSLSVPRFSYSPSPTTSPGPSVTSSRATTPLMPASSLEIRVNKLKSKGDDNNAVNNEPKIVIDASALSTETDVVETEELAKVQRSPELFDTTEATRQEDTSKLAPNNEEPVKAEDESQPAEEGQSANTPKREPEALINIQSEQIVEDIQKVDLHNEDNVSPPALPSSPPPSTDNNLEAELNRNPNNDTKEEGSPTPTFQTAAAEATAPTDSLTDKYNEIADNRGNDIV